MAEYDGIKTCTVHGDYTGQQEPQQEALSQTITPPSGSVEFTLSARVRSAVRNKIYIPKSQSVNLTAGAFSIRLFINDDEDLIDKGTAYQVVETIDGKRQKPFYIKLTVAMADTTVELADLPEAAPTSEQFDAGDLAARVTGLEQTIYVHVANHPAVGGDTTGLATVEYVDGQIQSIQGTIGEHITGDVTDPHPNSQYPLMVDGGKKIFTRDAPDPAIDPLVTILNRELWFPESGV